MDEHTALFVIDIQHDLAIDPANRIPHAARIVVSAKHLIAATRIRSPHLIVYVQHHEDPSSGPLSQGSKAWQLVFSPQTGNAEEILVHKTTGDAFESNPGLASALQAKGITTIAALGIQSECCVLSTCKGALAAGFKVSLLQGAHSTYESDSKSAEDIERDVEAELSHAGAEIVPWEAFILQRE